jgi:uncharacterized protein
MQNMRCPICKQNITWEGNAFRPFCSERCQMIDLDNWLEGRYRIPVPTDPDEEIVSEDGSAGTKGERD